jgi:hypothetical protein
MIFRTAIKTNAREIRIHESLYLVSFINPKAIEAAIICSTIEIIRATNLIIMDQGFITKVRGIFSIWK